MTFSGRTLMGVIFIAVTAAAVAGGFRLVGSPAEARLRRMDDRRVTDMRQIASAIDLYRTRTGQLPSGLDDVRVTGAWQVPPRDPETGAAYEYRVLQPLRYELCATFDRAAGSPDGWGTVTFWAHAAGRQCFPIELKAP